MAPRIAVTGPSGVGKSTLTATLAKSLATVDRGVTIIHQDDYFSRPKPDSYWSLIEAKQDNDCPEAVKMDALRAAVASAPSENIVLLDGFLLLQDGPLMAMIDAVVYLHAEAQTCLQRRLRRTVRSERENEGLIRYYWETVWPGFLRYTEPAMKALSKPHVVADGTVAEPADLAFKVGKDVEEMLQKLRELS